METTDYRSLFSSFKPIVLLFFYNKQIVANVHRYAVGHGIG